MSLEIFKSDDSIKEDGSFLCDGEFGLNCGVASDKGICIPWFCVCIRCQGLCCSYIYTWILNFIAVYT